MWVNSKLLYIFRFHVCQCLYHNVFYLLLQRLQPPRRLQWPWQVSRKGLDSQNEEEVLPGLDDQIKCETASQQVIQPKYVIY